MSALASILLPIQAPFQQVDLLIKDLLSQVREPHIKEVNVHLLQAPGKRLRPALALLAFQGFSESDPIKAVNLGAALELIHMASLVHDDIIDQAAIRHNQPCVHRVFGQEVGITMGVYLYSLALQCIAQIGDPVVLRRISHAVKGLCIGEMTQIFERDQDISVIDYLIVLKRKTAILFETACACGAFLAGATLAQQHQLKQYGFALGMLFQITDDVLDILGTPEELGKKVGQDFLLGETTLPLLMLLDSVSPTDKQAIIQAIQSKTEDGLRFLQLQLKQSDVPSRIRDMAQHYVQVAHRSLELPLSSDVKSALQSSLETVEKRAFKTVKA